MSGMREVRLIAERELTESFRSKSYWVTIAIFVAIVAAAIVIPRFLDSSTTYHVGLAGEVPAGLQADLELLVEAFDASLETTTFDDRAAATAAVDEDTVEVAVVFEADETFLVRREESSDTLVGILNQVVVSASARRVLTDAGLDDGTIAAALAPAPPTEVLVDAEASGRMGIGWVTGLVLYLAIFMGGMSVATGVSIEKSTRIAEVLVSSVRPTHLLAGKVLGIGLSTLTIVVAGALPFAAAIAAGWVDLPPAAAIDVVAAIGWFILGYGIYATAFGALGALVDRQEDLGSAVGPLSTIVVLSYLGTIVAAGDPGGFWTRVISFFPFSAPMVMPVRIAAGSASILEVVVAVAIGVITLLVLARLGGVIYRRALLRGGQRLKIRQVLTTAVVVLAMAVATMVGPGVTTAAAQVVPPIEPEYVRISPATNRGLAAGGSIGAWRAAVPGITDVRITSTLDGHQQPALWLAPNEAGPRPLLVALHSWSVRYDQIASIPYAQWAQRNGWAMIHPDFRGVSNDADATGSDLAVQDIADAINWAKAHADIDETNVYVIGFSGGGMMSLNMAGRHPDLIAGAVSWVPIYDLVEWYRYSASQRYANQIAASCGGNPLASQAARAQCLARSPRAHLDRARAAGVPVYIGHGLGDLLVLPEHAVWAFNHLADPADRITAAESAAIASHRLPAHLEGQLEEPTWFRPGDPGPRFARQSANVTLVLFSGGHNAVFNPGLEWMVRQTAGSEPSPRVAGATARLYHAAFDRRPDAAGHAYWNRLYLSGRSLSAIASQFVASSEFSQTYGNLNDDDFVRQLYRNVMDREADAGGLAHWTGVLRSGRTRGFVLIGFSQSAEMRSRTGTP